MRARHTGFLPIDHVLCRKAQATAMRRAAPSTRRRHRWGVVLAGGDGVRLRSLTRFLCGDDRPKQFCPLLGDHTLLMETRQRAERSIDPHQVLYSVTQAHRQYYRRDLAVRPSQIIVQPCNRGTAPAILYTLVHILQFDQDAIVAILPCDHYYSPEPMFTAALDSAFAIAEAQPESVVLLGAQPRGPEVQYGWIELGEAAVGPDPDVFRVRRFQEKPSLSVAQTLLKTGSLWNTFIMVGHINAFLELAHASAPDLMSVLRSARIPAPRRGETVERLYDRIAPADFSRQVLSPGTKRLVAAGLGEVEWNDLGDPERVISTLLAQNRDMPEWVAAWRRQSASSQSSTATAVA
jgi:mannose-1-phosphate guanylyltransferase